MQLYNMINTSQKSGCLSILYEWIYMEYIYNHIYNPLLRKIYIVLFHIWEHTGIFHGFAKPTVRYFPGIH